MKIQSTTPNLYTFKNNGNVIPQSQQKFTGVSTNLVEAKAEGFMERLNNKIAKHIVQIIDSKPFEKLIKATNKHESISNKLTSHLIVLGSTILSGFYVAKTLKNKDMEESKRKTLAVNQGLCWGLSTVLAYAFDGWARKNFDKKIIENFMKANEKLPKNDLKFFKDSLGIARSIIIIDTVYRFIAPVIVTPAANAIGNRLRSSETATAQNPKSIDKQA